MKKVILAIIIASLSVAVSCTRTTKELPVPLTSAFEVQVEGEAPNAKIRLVNQSKSATAFEWIFGEGSSIGSSTDETPTGIIVDKAGDLKITLTAKNGSTEQQKSQTITVGGNSAILSYTNIAFAQDPAFASAIGKFFSTSKGKMYPHSDVNTTTGPLIDLVYSQALVSFQSPHESYISPGIPIPGATVTKIKNFKSEFNTSDFDAMQDDKLLKNLVIEHDKKTATAFGGTAVVTFENSKGRKGAIKVLSFNNLRILVNIKVQKY